jgi:hypothetical protein
MALLAARIAEVLVKVGVAVSKAIACWEFAKVGADASIDTLAMATLLPSTAPLALAEMLLIRPPARPVLLALAENDPLVPVTVAVAEAPPQSTALAPP